ncbi:MAG TPA: D-glycerate dehydrogenase, partial [Solirubrobacterales bacterium]
MPPAAPARLAVTGRLPAAANALLEGAGEVDTADADGPLQREQLLRHVAGAEAIVCFLHDRVDAELLDAAGPGLEVVANVAVGYDNVDLEEAAARGV